MSETHAWRRVLCSALVFACSAGRVLAVASPPAGAEFQVNSYTVYAQRNPAVASDSAGNFVVVWTSYRQDGDFRGVFGQRYASSGTPLGTEFQVNTYTSSAQYYPAVASDSAGNFVVVWASYRQDRSYNGVFGQRYASTGAPLGTEFQVNTYTTDGQSTPAVASDSAGNFVVVWTSYRQDGDYRGVFGQRYASSGTPLGTEFQVNTYTSSAQYSPAVASDSAGNFVVVWTSYLQDRSYNGVFGQRYASTGAPLGTEFQVNTYTTDGQSTPRVASDSAGNFMVVWESRYQDGGYQGVFGQRYASSGAPLGTEFQVNTYTTDGQRRPAVASDGTGAFVVVWQSGGGQDGARDGVFGQRYASSGAPDGTEFQVNTYTTDYQGDPAVASNGAGAFVVAWESNCSGECDDGQDGSYTGVFGQRFSPPESAPVPATTTAPTASLSGLTVLALVLVVFGARGLRRQRRSPS